MRRSARAALTVLLLASGVSRADVGSTVAVVKFTNRPTRPSSTSIPTTPSAPFRFVTADRSITVTWSDGDRDPTGRFTFYHLDHEPTFQVGVDDIEASLAKKIDDPINNSGGYFASCVRAMDAGVTCSPIVRDPAGNCANQIVWNTAAVPAGTHWLVAVNNDPPFHVYNASLAPVRVVHGAATPAPAVLVVRPDGTGAWDRSYHLQWLADGKAPLSFELSYGVEAAGAAALTPAGSIATALSSPTRNADELGSDGALARGTASLLSALGAVALAGYVARRAARRG